MTNEEMERSIRALAKLVAHLRIDFEAEKIRGGGAYSVASHSTQRTLAALDGLLEDMTDPFVPATPYRGHAK